jgi:hypothetical protein
MSEHRCNERGQVTVRCPQTFAIWSLPFHPAESPVSELRYSFQIEQRLIETTRNYEAMLGAVRCTEYATLRYQHLGTRSDLPLLGFDGNISHENPY